MKKILVLSIFIVSCSGGKNSTGYSIISDMMYSEAFEAQTLNYNYENAQTNQPPVEGTIPRGYKPHPMDEEGNPLVLTNPYEMTAYGYERGRMWYENVCAACHGIEGKANGLVVTKGGYPKPPSFKARRWKKIDKYPSGHVYNVIMYGLGNMSAYAQQMTEQDRWYTAVYVREKLMRGPSKKKKAEDN